jgi:hypothetical protein
MEKKKLTLFINILNLTIMNKLFTFMNPILEYIDNGRFFREPFRWLYVIFGVFNLLFPIGILTQAVNMKIFDADGKIIVAFLLMFIILCCGAWGSYLFWMNRKRQLKAIIKEEDEFVAIPVVSHLIQAFGEWIGLYIGIIGTLCAIIITLFSASYGLDRLLNQFIPFPSGVVIAICPLYGFLIIVFARLWAELCRALAAIANNTKK